MSKSAKALELEIPSQLRLIQPAVSEVLQYCRMSLPEVVACRDLEDQLRLSLAECLANIMKHAYRGVEENSISLRVSVSANQIRICTTDCGEEFRNAKNRFADRESALLDPDNLPEGSMGLFLIFAEMDTVTYQRRDGKNLWALEKYVVSDAVRSAPVAARVLNHVDA